MQDDNIEGFTLDSSFIDDSPLIEEYLANFNYSTSKQSNISNPPQEGICTNFPTIMTPKTTFTATNVFPEPNSPTRVPTTIREKLKGLLAREHEKKELYNGKSASKKMVATPSEVKQMIAENKLSSNHDDKPHYNQSLRGEAGFIPSNENDEKISNEITAKKFPPKSKPELAFDELKKMDEQSAHEEEEFKGSTEEESNFEEHNETRESIDRDGDEQIHNQGNGDVSLIEEDEKQHESSFAVEEERLEMSDDEEDIEKRRATEDLTLSKLEASALSIDQSLTLSSLEATPARTTSPTRARPQSSMRSSTPSYMNSTKASISKEISRTSTDLRASTSDTRMRFGMINYQQRPPSANRSASPSIVHKRRVTPRKERIYNVVPTLHFEDISVTTGLGTISVPNYRLTSLKGLGVKRDLKILYLQNNYLTSLNYLETQPNLEVLYVANNCISSFYGFKSQPKLTLISLEGNPISKHPHYRLMTLIVCGQQLKKIDGEMVQFREREFVRQYLSANEKAVEAIRCGWLMDPKPRTLEEFQEIIQGLSLQNFDDRESIRNSQLFKDLASGALAKTTTAVDLNEFEERKKQPHKEEQHSSDMSHSTISNSGFNSSFLTNYINEIKQLKAQLEKKAEELKDEKQKYKDLKESSIGIEELNLVDRFTISNIAVSLNSTNETVEHVAVSFTLDSMEISKSEELLRDIKYESVTRTSLLVDEQKLFRVHIRMNSSELLDIVTADKKQSLSIYKILHMKVAHANKQKKLRQQANK